MPPKHSTIQNYPRIADETSEYVGFFDDSTISEHTQKLDTETVKQHIRAAIIDASTKSSMAAFAVSPEDTEETRRKKYRKEGKALLAYFKKYNSDPASAAFQLQGQHYRTVGTELFRQRMLQKERMNAGWRYQYLTVYCARDTQRFRSVSDIGGVEADFNAVVDYADGKGHLNLYVSVKNRRNTIGGQDFPKASSALEHAASSDKNRRGAYLCVFGIAMDRGQRQIRRTKSGDLISPNVEIWLSDYFWPFFTTLTYEDMMLLVLEVLLELRTDTDTTNHISIPDEVLEEFGRACRNAGLITAEGIFDDARTLVRYICRTDELKPSQPDNE